MQEAGGGGRRAGWHRQTWTGTPWCDVCLWRWRRGQGTPQGDGWSSQKGGGAPGRGTGRGTGPGVGKGGGPLGAGGLSVASWLEVMHSGQALGPACGRGKGRDGPQGGMAQARPARLVEGGGCRGPPAPGCSIGKPWRGPARLGDFARAFPPAPCAIAAPQVWGLPHPPPCLRDPMRQRGKLPGPSRHLCLPDDTSGERGREQSGQPGRFGGKRAA